MVESMALGCHIKTNLSKLWFANCRTLLKYIPGLEWCKVRLREGPAQPKYRPRPQWLSNSQQCLCLGLAWSARRQTTNTSRKLRGTLLREKKPLESEYIIKYENPFFVFDNLRINHMYILYKLSIISRIYI